jgi:lipoyl-dependent peroxiredoxin subunit D
MLDELKNQLPDYAKDLKLNLSQVLTPNDNLSASQIVGIALSAAYATRSAILIGALENDANMHVEEATIQAAKAAASIMGMNNIYYRFVHLANDAEYHKMPLQLRMNIMMNPGIDKIDFELFSLAVSAINGCGLCMDSHAKTLQKSALSKASIQHTIRIAAVLNGLSQVCFIENY